MQTAALGSTDCTEINDSLVFKLAAEQSQKIDTVPETLQQHHHQQHFSQILNVIDGVIPSSTDMSSQN